MCLHLSVCNEQAFLLYIITASTMKAKAIIREELEVLSHNGTENKLVSGYSNVNRNPTTAYLFFSFLLFLLTLIFPLSLLNDNLRLPSRSIKMVHHSKDTNQSSSLGSRKRCACDVFVGRWVNDSSVNKPYYTNSTCREIYDQLNCMKFGRRDSDFLRWRWKPDECELPRFDAGLFLELMSNKSLAFVGDSVGRNQMHSLICLLSAVAYPVDQSQNCTTENRRWFYTEYNFTIAMFWAPYLVKVIKGNSPTGQGTYSSVMQLDMDRASDSWATQIEDFDYVIISAGQWFFRPLIFHFNDTPVSCHICQTAGNLTTVDTFYGYKMAFRRAFKAILGLANYKGVTLLRTFSPAHFENGDWDKGGSCPRSEPYADDEARLEGYILEMYTSQVREFKAAKEMAKKRGLEFRLLDTTRAMVMRPDGHPNYYGHSPTANASIADCVHWCLPGPIDTWNELFQEMIRPGPEIWRF